MTDRYGRALGDVLPVIAVCAGLWVGGQIANDAHDVLEPEHGLWSSCYVTDCGQYVGPPGPEGDQP